MKNLGLTAAILLVLMVAAFSVVHRVHAPITATSESTSAAFRYEIVSTEAAREQGLSGRADVPHDHGMLFVFEKPDRYGFWMKDMLIPIDIIWLKDDGTIMGIEDSVSPDTYPTPFYPSEAVRYVLETRAGEARAQGWGAGTVLALPVSQK